MHRPERSSVKETAVALPRFHTLRRSLGASILAAAAAALLSGCCSYFYYDCAPQQPAFYTAYFGAGTFLSARDAAEGLLSTAKGTFTPSAATPIAARYAAAATAANAWEDYAQAALRGSGPFDEGESARRLDDVKARVGAFADAVHAAAGNPSNLNAPLVQLPSQAVIDDASASPLVADAVQTASAVDAGVAAIKAMRNPLARLDATTREEIADAIAGARWESPDQIPGS
jgi:hypothetical protein